MFKNEFLYFVLGMIVVMLFGLCMAILIAATNNFTNYEDRVLLFRSITAFCTQ
jgi:hypothetical protein